MFTNGSRMPELTCCIHAKFLNLFNHFIQPVTLWGRSPCQTILNGILYELGTRLFKGQRFRNINQMCSFEIVYLLKKKVKHLDLF